MNDAPKNRIAELRNKSGLTLKKLGNFVGMRDSTISQYETGKREPKLATWKKLADFFGVSMLYLMGETDNKHIAKSTDTSISEDGKSIETKISFDLDSLIKEYRLKENFLAPIYLSDLLKGAPIYKKDGMPLSDKETEILKSFLKENFKDLS